MELARRIRGLLLVVVLLGPVGMVGCRQPEPPPEPPPPPRTELVVATRNAPTTYYEDHSGRLVGLEYELVTRFADWAELPLEFVVLPSVGEILEAVEGDQVDLAAAGLTRTTARAEAFVTGPAYQEIAEEVVCHPRARVEEIDDLFGKRIRIIADSSYDERLRALKLDYPGLLWTTTEEESTEQLLKLVSDGEIDCTVADSNIVAIDRRFLPKLRTPFSLGEHEYLSWFVAEHATDLVEPLRTWFQEMEDGGHLDALQEKYYSHVQDFDRWDTTMFFKRVEARLPPYEEMFRVAEGQTGLDWRMLAAVAYQESHWDPEAVSRTGVRGLMMLTQETAADVGVDRLDPFASVIGGAIYLRGLINRVPAHIDEPDRIWLALAAYNVGYAHLEDARKLAVELSENPNSWAGVKKVLPLLSQPSYYRDLRHGYARGNEPVVYVEHIRNYYDLLSETQPREGDEATTVPSGVVASTALLTGKPGLD